jgi:hypothetical protein
VERALREEDPVLDERRGRLRERDRTKAGDVADEPPGVEEAIGLDRPDRPLDAIERRDVLGEGGEIRVVAANGEG